MKTDPHWLTSGPIWTIMKNKGVFSMKKFLLLLIVCVMIISFAYADNMNDFNVYAGIFGASELKEYTESISDGKIIRDYRSDDCRIVFVKKDEKLKSIIVVGTGDKFLAYCAAAIMQFDTSSENRATNYGNLLSAYLMTVSGTADDDFVGYTVSGAVTGMKKNSDKCQFTVLTLD